MNLYLDEDSAIGLLAKLLRKEGHAVVVPTDVGLRMADDPKQMLHAALHQLVLLTRNSDDFRTLHQLVQAVHGRHPGLLVVRRDNSPKRDMRDREVVRAVAKLLAAGVPIANEFHILNAWR